jgi:hypothetical protein
MSEEDYTLKINNKIIWDFFQANPGLDFETCVLILIDILSLTQKNAAATIQTATNARIISMLSENSANITEIKQDIAHLKTDLYVKFIDIKKEYTENIKHIILNSSSLYSDKLTTHIDKATASMIDKTNLLLTEIIPKTQGSYSQQIVKTINEHHQGLLDETQRILASKPSEDALRTFLSQFETKTTQLFQTIQQPLMTYVSASEDRLLKSMNTLQTQSSAQDKMLETLYEFLNKTKYRNSNHKGKASEGRLEDILNSLYPSCHIKNTSGIPNSGDLIMEERDGLKPRILFENKDYSTNVGTEEVDKFVRDIHTQKCHGVFISQSSGIVGKNPYQIEIFTNSVAVYVHHCNYEPEKIKMAVDIIDSINHSLELYARRQGNGNTPENVLSDATMDDINAEYTKFVQNKLAVIESIKFSSKEMCRRLTAQMDEIRFPTLGSILGNKYGHYHSTGEAKSAAAAAEASADDSVSILCPLCLIYKAKNPTALASHRRGCAKKK